MPLTLAQLRTGFLKGTSTTIDDWENGNTDVDLYINRSWWDVADEFDFREKEADILVFPTVAGTRLYNLTTEISPASLDCLQRISIVDPISLEHTDLILISDSDYENDYSEDSTQQSKPTNYFRRGSNIYLYPTPEQVYDLNLYYNKILADVISGGPPIPQVWHEIIQLGSVWRGLLDLKDYQSAREIKAHQKDMISGRSPVKVKELTDTRLAGVSVLGRDY